MPNSPTIMKYGEFSFSPVPLFTESVETFRDTKLDALFKRTTREFTGVLLGNVASSGAFPELFDKKEALKEALCSGNQEFQLIHEGVPLISGEFPRVNGPAFQEGTWVSRIDYTFSTETDAQLEGASGIQSFTETWSFEEAEDRRTVNVQHNISAVGINTSGSGINNSFFNAKGFVEDRTGFLNAQANAPFFAQVSGIPFSAFEELRSEQHDIAAGSFQVAERFTLSSGNFIHTQNAQFATDAGGISTVSINGNVRGLGRDGDDIAFQRAKTAFNGSIRLSLPATGSGIYSSYGGEAILFTSNESDFSVTQNPFLGTIDYSIQYSDSLTDNLPSGILEFVISVQEQDAVRVFALFGIPERTLGNVVQDVGTSTPGTVSITGSATGKPGFSFNNLLAFVEDQINAVRPDPNNFVQLIPAGASITEDERANRVQFNIQYTFTKELSQVFGDASQDIKLV